MSTRPSRKTTPAATSIALRGSADEAGYPLPPPVARSVIRLAFASSPEALVNPSLPLHFPPIEQVRVGHHFAGALEVQFPELGPFGGDHQRIAAFCHGIHVGHKGRVFQN